MPAPKGPMRVCHALPRNGANSPRVFTSWPTVPFISDGAPYLEHPFCGTVPEKHRSLLNRRFS